MNKTVSFLKKPDLYLGIVRYVLAMGMIPYAITKILRTQFVLLPAANWQRPIEEISGSAIAWTFLGYSPWFQVLLGFLELIPALLLLFRRTTLLGAILLLPMTINVYLINIALNLWDATKQISLILLLLNLTVLIFKWKSIVEIVNIIIARAKRFRFNAVEALINTVLVVVIGYFAMQPLIAYKNERNELTGDWYNLHPIEWVLTEEKINDSILPARNYKAYYGAYGSYSRNGDNGLLDRDIRSYSLNKEKHELTLFPDYDTLGKKYSYSIK
ncbi:MAG: hypothetical protein EOO02_11385, partial [Chitinophagaceae bacterium]